MVFQKLNILLLDVSRIILCIKFKYLSIILIIKKLLCSDEADVEKEMQDLEGLIDAENSK